MIEVSLPNHTPDCVGRCGAVFVSVFYRGIDFENPPHSDDHSLGVIGEWGPLRIKESKRFLWLNRAEECVQHRELIAPILNPQLVKWQLRLNLRLEVESEFFRS